MKSWDLTGGYLLMLLVNNISKGLKNKRQPA
jgi:hypothetical protein